MLDYMIFVAFSSLFLVVFMAPGPETTTKNKQQPNESRKQLRKLRQFKKKVKILIAAGWCLHCGLSRPTGLPRGRGLGGADHHRGPRRQGRRAEAHLQADRPRALSGPTGSGEQGSESCNPGPLGTDRCGAISRISGCAVC